MSDAPYVEPDRVKKLARSFESHAYDLQSHLRKFHEKTGEEAITDGFGLLTESDEINEAYIGFSNDVRESMQKVYRHLDAIGAALRQVTQNTETTDDDVAVLFGESKGGGNR